MLHCLSIVLIIVHKEVRKYSGAQQFVVTLNTRLFLLVTSYAEKSW
jgi:hypothetical protein